MQTVKLFLHSFLVSFVLFSILIMACVLWVQPYTKTPQQSTIQGLALPRAEDSCTILIILTEDSPQCYALLSLHPYNGEISVKSYLPCATVSGLSLSTLWEQCGPDTISCELSKHSKKNIHRCIFMNKKELCSLVDATEPISLSLAQPFRYQDNGISVTLEAGTQRFNATQLHNYLKQDLTPQQYDDILLSVSKKIFLALASENGQEFFLSMLDWMDSDISLMDFDNYYETLQFMVRMQPDLFLQ